MAATIELKRDIPKRPGRFWQLCQVDITVSMPMVEAVSPDGRWAGWTANPRVFGLTARASRWVRRRSFRPG